MMGIKTAIVRIEDQIEACRTIRSYSSFGFACSVGLAIYSTYGPT